MSQVKECLVCKTSSTEIPVTKFYYQESEFFICPQHMPVIIHNPQQLIGLLEGADKFKGV
jgi:recombinational DNA repair protein (RecF pathway)